MSSPMDAQEAFAAEESKQGDNADSRYSYDEEKLQKLKDEKPWMKNAKHFDKVALSPSALIKIVSLPFSSVCIFSLCRSYRSSVFKF
jgi:hypothetical protein